MTFLSFAANQGYQYRLPTVPSDPAAIVCRLGSAVANLSNGLLRDNSAWYHFVLVNNAGTTTLHMNGVLQRTGNTPTGSSRMTIGSNLEGSQDDRLCGALADYYFIDGQVLEPTAFGRFNAQGVWVPREVDFTPAQMRFSDYVYTDDRLSATPNFDVTSRNFNPSYPVTRGFDGDVSLTFGAAFANGWAVFRPAQPIPVTDKVEILAGFSAGGAIWANGADTGKVFGDSTTWVDLGDLGGTTYKPCRTSNWFFRRWVESH